MKTWTLRREQFVDLPRDEVFDFFKRPENLEALTPKDLGFTILTPRPIAMNAGSLIDYTVRIAGIPLHWRTLISRYEPPSLFVDQQLKGPYALWHHTHRFLEHDGGTKVVDEVVYALGWGWLGRLAHALFVRRRLEHIFDHRAAVLETILRKRSLAKRPQGGKPMNILVAGGTGFIGKSLVCELLERGDAVTLLTRDPASAAAFSGEKLRVVRWDAKSSEPLVEEMERHDAVVNLIGENVAGGRWTARRKAAILESRVAATAAITGAIARAAVKPKVLVNASAVGYYGDVPDGDVAEDARKGEGFLAEVCARWEDVARAAEQDGVRVALLRIGVVLEKGGGALQKMIPPFLLFAGGPLGSGKQWFPWVHRDDVVGAVLHALDTASVSGPVNVAAPDAARMEEFCVALGDALNRPSWAPVPGFALRLMLGEMSQMLLGGQKIAPKRLEATGYKWRHPKLDAALASILDGR